MYEQFNDNTPATIVGSFVTDKNADFKSGVKAMLENFRSAYQVDALDNVAGILKVDAWKEDYKNRLIGDVLQEGAFNFNDEYLASHPAKLEQLFENSALEIVEESSMGQLLPIVGLSLPILKKNYLECHSKDVVLTEVPNKPIVKMSFERKFLKDKTGNKYYIPEIFYDDTYKTALAKAKGKKVEDSWYPTAANSTLPFQDLDILGLSGGTLEARDSLALDFVIDSVKIEVMGADGTTPELVELVGLGIQPDFANNGTFQARITAKNKNDGTEVKDILLGQLDSYSGKVSVSSTAGKIKKVRFGGHLSNENNYETLELDRERENKEWKITDGHKLNTGISIEKIKDYRALFNIDVTTEVIADMSTVLSQTEDSDIFGFLDTSLGLWKTRKDNLPFGYSEIFVESFKFKATPESNVHITVSQYIATELKFTLDREIDALKVKLKTPDIMFVVYGHPNNIVLIQDQIKWIIDDNTKVGGIQLDYKFGLMSSNQNRVQVVSTLKVGQEKGLRIVAYPLSKEVITFKHFKYSMNIENAYRNPNTPNIPNIMATSRYLTTEVLPVQGEFLIEENSFGRQTL